MTNEIVETLKQAAKDIRKYDIGAIFPDVDCPNELPFVDKAVEAIEHGGKIEAIHLASMVQYVAEMMEDTDTDIDKRYIRAWYAVGEEAEGGGTHTVETFDTLDEAQAFAKHLGTNCFIDRWKSTSITPGEGIDDIDEDFEPIRYEFPQTTNRKDRTMNDERTTNELVRQLRSVARDVERHGIKMLFPSLYPPADSGTQESEIQQLHRIAEACNAIQQGGKLDTPCVAAIIHYIADQMQV